MWWTTPQHTINNVMERCHTWIQSSFDESVKYLQVNHQHWPKGLQQAIEVQAHVLSQQFGLRTSLCSHLLIGDECEWELVSKNHPSHQLSGPSRVALDSSVNKILFVGSFMYFLAYCNLFSQCLALIPISRRAIHISRRAMFLVDFDTFFNPAASNISPLFFSYWHSLLDEFCSGFDQS